MSVRVIVPNFVTPGQTVADIWRFFDFQNCGRPPSWICLARVCTTHEGHLMVLIVVHNLIGMGYVVLKTCKFQCYASLA